MSSELIKHIAGNILTTIKNKYQTYYVDNGRKEQLVKNILLKIDIYSKQINKNTYQQITNQIISEIIQESHSEKKNIKNIYPQSPQSSSHMSKVQFERNSIINNGKPIQISNN